MREMMTTSASPPSPPGGLTASGVTPFSVPAKHNPKLLALVERINADEELWQWWRCANVNASERLGLADHGEVHARIVANAALKLLRLLCAAGQVPGAIAHHRLTAEEAELIVVLAAALHDVGRAIHGDQAAVFSPLLAHLKAKELLTGLFPARKRTLLVAETLHAIVTQQSHLPCLTLESGVLTLAEALDLAASRARSPGALAATVSEVVIRKGQQRPVCVEIRFVPDADAIPVDKWLDPTLAQSALSEWVEVITTHPPPISHLPLSGVRV
jgi:uncharacterized protein